MSPPRFYCREPLAPAAVIELPEPVARHAVRVLRLSPGAPVILFDGRGGQYLASIEAIEKTRVFARLGEWDPIEAESPIRVTLLQAIQAGEKMDFTIQKAVELGVHAIVPLASRRSVVQLSGDRAAKRVAHWQGVAASACEQCGRNQVPVVANVSRLMDYMAQPSHALLRIMLHPEASETLSSLPRHETLELLIGAEGGLDPQEVLVAEQSGFRAVRLGPRVLRTETAGLAALAALQLLWGDLCL